MTVDGQRLGIVIMNSLQPNECSQEQALHSEGLNQRLIAEWEATRRQTEALCEPLSIEDMSLQADIFVSPPKWHLAHTSWFFETFILSELVPSYQAFHPRFEYLFNSYYNAVGEQFDRSKRGLLSRPSLDEVIAYRRYVDQQMMRLLSGDDRLSDDDTCILLTRCMLGVQHEKQHQELLLMDIRYSLFQNPLLPAYQAGYLLKPHKKEQQTQSREMLWVSHEGGLVEIGADHNVGDEHFCFDNELPRHSTYLEPFQIAKNLVKNRDYLEFIEAGGYSCPEFWLADGWSTVNNQNWTSPLYWLKQESQWFEFTLAGLQPLDLDAPVTNISGYEAAAFAEWAGARLPTEAEWEFAVSQAESHSSESLNQVYTFGWQWTASAYQAYPGYRPEQGAIGEYNGKFMSNQWVLRGGASISPANHLRVTYRNFFYPQDRWVTTSIRLAR
jgi:ergothioneine biosynthesis protein EgtB